MTTLAKHEPISCFYVECHITYPDGETLICNYAPFATREEAVKYIAFRETLGTNVCNRYKVLETENVNRIPNVLTVNPNYTLSSAAFSRKMRWEREA